MVDTTRGDILDTIMSATVTDTLYVTLFTSFAKALVVWLVAVQCSVQKAGYFEVAHWQVIHFTLYSPLY